MKSIKHFIWDFDGTLMDTYPYTLKYLKAALCDFGQDVDESEMFEKMMLRTITYTINYYVEKFDIPELRQRFNLYYANEKNENILPFPNVVEVLDRIKSNGANNYIFTNRGDSIYPLLDKCNLRDKFTEIVTSAHPSFVIKPAPDAILYLMEKYGGTPKDTVMIGDRICDLGSAVSAGCKTIHLFTPALPQYPSCDWRINNFNEMLDMLK